MDDDQRLYFRDQLREARATALQDAEAFDAIIYVLERMGVFLRGVTTAPAGLGVFEDYIRHEAERSSLAGDMPSNYPELHIEYSELYKSVREGRNKAMHEGAFARHLTDHAIELSIILEHALMTEFERVDQFMVRNPICAAAWHPISFIRQSMLKNSFSYLPVLVTDQNTSTWMLVSDLAIASYLKTAANPGDLRSRLTRQLKEALASQDVKLIAPRRCKPGDSVVDMLNNWDGVPVLVLSQQPGELAGILTPFDLL